MDLKSLIEELMGLNHLNLEGAFASNFQNLGSESAKDILLNIPGITWNTLNSKLRSAEVVNQPLILKYIENGCEHGYSVKQPVIIKLDCIEDFSQVKEYHEKQRLLLWHGTKLENVASIIENGFKTPASKKQMFGKGIYFADRFSKSANYCGDTSHGASGYMFLCEVAVGKSYIAEKAQKFDSAPTVTTRNNKRIVCDSVLCVGERIPDVMEQVVLPNKCVVPCGPTVENQNISNCTLAFNEYIVYNPELIRIHYLVKFEFAHEVMERLSLKLMASPGTAKASNRVEGRNNLDLMAKLKANGSLKSSRLEAIMKRVDRGHFAPTQPYYDAAQSIGFGASISAPHMHARTLDLLTDYLSEGTCALDIGSGSGYLTTCMALMVGEQGRVVGIDHIPQLVWQAGENASKGHMDLLASGTLIFVEGDGKLGWEDGGPYDVIHIGGAVEEVPRELFQQLKKGGRLIAPVGPPEGQYLQQVDKLQNGSLRTTNLLKVVYGALVDLDPLSNKKLLSHELSSENSKMVNMLKANGSVKCKRVEQIMKLVDRAHFCPFSSYSDSPQCIGCNANISAPHMHAEALEAIKYYLVEGAVVLDVGSGSGYLTVCMALMTGETGRVVGIEHIEELATNSLISIGQNYPELLDGRIEIVVGDGRKGYANRGPYDVIHVGAASPIVPNALVRQLKPGGSIFIPVGSGGEAQHFKQVQKLADGSVETKSLFTVVFSALTDVESQLRRF